MTSPSGNFTSKRQVANQDVFNMRLVVVGDAGCGKTALLLSLRDTKFSFQYVPTVMDNWHYMMYLKQDGRKTKVSLEIWDTAGQENYQQIRALNYTQSDIILLCYDVCMRQSFDNIANSWMEELSENAPGCPYLICGNKLDRVQTLLDEKEQHPEKDDVDFVTPEEAKILADKIGAWSSHQTSAYHHSQGRPSGVRDVFVSAAECGMEMAKRASSEDERHSKKCVLM